MRITSVRVVDAQTRRPAPAPLRRTRDYAYVVRYRVAGERTMRVTRRAVIVDAQGTVMARVRPPATFDEPGSYFATSRISIGPDDPVGTYRLRYAVVVRGRRAVDRAVRVTRLRFR
ncbi:MAG: hypothetical protein KDC33_03095 [Thermoleophilia bacterium]|nr:hypothetical protein [Thermoleophilia bacterium]